MVRKLVLSLIAVFVGGGILVLAQNKQVFGTVTGADGSPIAGATVIIDGTSVGTSTSADGKFAIAAPSNGTISISFIGYETQKIAVAGKTHINVTLKEDAQSIDDVIVVAFGTSKKEAFTGSAVVLKADDLAKHQTTNVMNALVGSVAGLQMRGSTGQPGAAAGSVNIRGISSMYAGTEPLIILDGAPYSANLSNIPQSEIESVTVLKDAASASLYGARGAAGVIIVTTKKGKTREAIINVDMKWGVNSRALKTYDVITNPGQYYEAYYAQLYNRYYYGDGMSAIQAEGEANKKMLSDLAYNVFSYPENEKLIVDGKLNPKATLGRKVTNNGIDYWMQPDDWTEEAYSNSLRQEYNISINGATDRSSYYMNVGYLNEDGIVSNSNYERISARVKADYQAKKWLKVGANVGYVNTNQDQNSNWGTTLSAANLFYYTSGIAPIYPVYMRTVDQNGKVTIQKDQYGNKSYDYGVAGKNYGVQRPFLATGNPLGENQYNKYGTKGNQMNANAFADFDFTSYLKFNITSTVIWGNSDISDFGNMFYGTPANVGGDIERISNTSLRTNNLQTLTYYDTFGRHNLNVMAGHEYYNTKTRYLSAHARGMFSPGIPEINGAAKPDVSNSYSTEYNVEGYFMSAQYDYDNKYYASASYRLDASSYFDPAHRWGSFWSFGAAWILSKENFLSKANWIDMLKLKASIGQQGNDNIGAYAYTDMYRIVAASETEMSASFWQKGNPNITWETTTNFNLGVEFSFWKGRLAGGVDFYNKKTSDLLFWVSLPESSGSRGQYDNIGDIRNQGVEINLSGVLVRSKLIEWSIGANLSHNATKILSLPKAKTVVNGGFSESDSSLQNTFWYREGGELYNAYCQAYAGVDEYGKSLFYIDTKDENGKTIVKGGTTNDFTAATKYEHGSILPKVFGGFGTNLRIKDFDLSVTFDYQIGGKVFDHHYQSLIGSVENSQGAGSAIHKDWVKAWSPQNPNSNIPRWQYGDTYGAASSDRFLTDASYLNFQSFTVGYTIPEKLLRNKVKIRIYAAGENLAFWSARKGLDPRYTFSGNEQVISYSPIRTISGGVQLTF